MIGYASTVQFGPGEGSSYPRVESRMLLAGLSGKGEVEVNGTTLTLTPKMIMVLPWGHSVRYRPDLVDPYLVYGAHLIPWHAASEPVEIRVSCVKSPSHNSRP